MSDQITFGTDGWRAVIAEGFTFANLERVVYAIGRYVIDTYQADKKDLPVYIGYDTRFLADKFAQRAVYVLNSMGIKAKVANRDVPTPVIAFHVQNEPTAGAIQLTASHNPPEYCGIKYIPHFGGPATNDITAKIVSALDGMPADFDFEPCSIETYDPKSAYMATIRKLIDFDKIKGSGLKIAYDALYSTSRGYIDEFLALPGVEVKTIHNWRDPLFGGGMPEPKPECLKELISLVVDGKYDIGLATDGDADRFGVIDEKGNYFSPNQLLALVTRHLVKNRKMNGGIVRTVATTHLLDCLAEKYNLKIFETPVGFKYIGELMRKEDVLIGGEESGGISVKGHVPEKDGILGNLLVIEMLAYEKKSLSAIWQDLQAEMGVQFIGLRDDLHLNPFTQKALMNSMKEEPFSQIGDTKVEKVGRADGIKFYFDQFNWILVRPSGTEPLIRLYAEGTDFNKINKLMQAFKSQVDEIVQKALKEQSAKKVGATVG